MPQLTLGSAGCHGSPGPCARAALVRALDQAPRTGREEEPAQKSSEQPSCDVPKPWTSSHPQMWRKRRRKLFSFTGWYAFLLAAALWSVCHMGAPLSLEDMCLWGALLCLLCGALGGCDYVPLWYTMSPLGRDLVPAIQEEAVTQSKMMADERSTSSGVPILLGFALVDSLLLSVLQEPLADPSGLHIQDLLSRLESVSNTLERIPPGSESMKLDSVLSDKVTLIRNYLRKRGSLLRRLLLVQAEFESGVKELQDGVERRWGQLEELHTGVTLTREGDQDHTDLASAHHGAETLFADLSHHRNQLDGCQDHLKDSTQLLQELMWSHSSAGNTLRSCNSESVWPELLLQVNMEQFDKVQESFLSLEQQTATFQAHLEGLSRGKDGEHASRASSPDLNTRHSSEVSSERPDSEGEADVRLSLCERSAQQLSSTIGRLRKSGKKNKKVIGD
ncbi:uncharacterized protein si:ch211-151h10.2 isoform X1 [Syngnathoides biaculeatus]|uniref:uncharacterized protein si:ch211-151h10.2 isoform X1 n=1 Tax=Syngnathoides biaculeatus TaxID=300417 RepID=UPI002ADDDD04|nr:uncharacterized protein si:ch211-151h10.2 isoform X1 [Syngnathoides biaculeatus]